MHLLQISKKCQKFEALMQKVRQTVHTLVVDSSLNIVSLLFSRYKIKLIFKFKGPTNNHTSTFFQYVVCYTKEKEKVYYMAKRNSTTLPWRERLNQGNLYIRFFWSVLYQSIIQLLQNRTMYVVCMFIKPTWKQDSYLIICTFPVT